MKINFTLSALLLTTFISAEKPVLPAPTPSIHDQLAMQEFSPTAFLHALKNKVTVAETPKTTSVYNQKDDLDFCKKMIKTADQSGYTVDELSPSGFTALQLFILYYLTGAPTESCVTLMLQKNAAVNIVDQLGRTPLHYLMGYAAISLLNNATPEVTQKTASNKDSVKDVSTKKTTTPENNVPSLHPRTTTLELIELFLSYGADPFVADKDNVSPIQIAVANQDIELLQLLEKYRWIELVQLSPEEEERLLKQMKEEAEAAKKA